MYGVNEQWTNINPNFQQNHQAEFIKRVRNHSDLTSLLDKQKIPNQNPQENKNSSNEELFADIEKARNNQNSSGESRNKRSQSHNNKNLKLEETIHQFNFPQVLILNYCQNDGDENTIAQCKQSDDPVFNEIQQVFTKQTNFPNTPDTRPTNEAMSKYDVSTMIAFQSTEISSPGSYLFLSTQQSLTDSDQLQYQQFIPSHQTSQFQYCEENQRRKRKTISDEDSHMYIIHPELIEKDSRTTLMIKNIPNKYTVQLLLDQIDYKNDRKYDFFYLPIDFKNHCNMGYAFINFIDPKYIVPFYHEFHQKKWPHFNSEKICVLRYARIQGRQALIGHFKFSRVMNQKDKKVKPVIIPDTELSKLQRLIQSQREQQNDQFLI